MKTTGRKFATAGATLMAMLILAGPAMAELNIDAKIQIRPRPSNDLQVWIWPDRGEGSDYRAGDEIALFVEANRDCYLILYDIDTRGNLNILFPYDPWTDNFVRGGETIRLPGRHEGLDWIVEGPPGVEYVQALASTFPIDPPDWPVYMRSVNGRDAVSHDRKLNDFRAYDDRLAYIEVVNRKITRRHWDWCATDMATFNVRPRRHRIIHSNWDPWPEIFYGEIYIGWPIGGRIYVDGVFIGVAPLHVPRHRWGKHVITCYDGDRMVRRHTARFSPKWEYNYKKPVYGKVDVRHKGHVKVGKRGTPRDFEPAPVRRKIKSHEKKSGSIFSRIGRAVEKTVSKVTHPNRIERHKGEKFRKRDAVKSKGKGNKTVTKVTRTVEKKSDSKMQRVKSVKKTTTVTKSKRTGGKKAKSGRR